MRAPAAAMRHGSAGKPRSTGSMPIIIANEYSDTISSSSRNAGLWLLIAVNDATSAPASVSARATSVATRPPRQ
ncbi:hypothetical protein BC477_09125 [Clavibacter michiganensis subsp. michiganensis]|uniref:Uncharacterized protein n=1 Tax=Clavibacter michiganensis subsp. michiganensis TaxID=33013 RepID=A0A251XN78_CLAMM|nr:hypothetical protein BC477_09125 [Clavibacter michiganensis subsp. michiganensis]OUE04886.1 hypothetical protein CMMCAS07_08050 [Clavibacter michiganensis subsp. michiganensis]